MNISDKDQICINYALGLLYQFIQDNIGDIKTELERLGYTNIITLERVKKLGYTDLTRLQDFKT